MTIEFIRLRIICGCYRCRLGISTSICPWPVRSRPTPSWSRLRSKRTIRKYFVIQRGNNVDKARNENNYGKIDCSWLLGRSNRPIKYYYTQSVHLLLNLGRPMLMSFSIVCLNLDRIEIFGYPHSNGREFSKDLSHT